MPKSGPAALLLALSLTLPVAAAGPGDAGVSPAPSPSPGAEYERRRKGTEVPISGAARQAVLGNPLLQRLSTVAGRMRFTGGAQGAWRWRRDVMGEKSVPLLVPVPRGSVELYATDDGKRLWLAAAQVRDEAAVLRLGDLLPLLSELGIEDREAALAVTQVSIAGGGAPPTYTLAFRTGVTWKHRAALAAAEKSGRALVSHTTGRVTVLGAFVLVDAQGELHVQRRAPEGEQLPWLKQTMVPRGCRDLEAALRSKTPASAAAAATKALAEPSISQACAARYLVEAGVPDAAARLRAAFAKNRIAWPGALVEALTVAAPDPSEVNLKAVSALLRRLGPAGADGVCRGAPLTWLDRLLEREDLRPDVRAVVHRCAWR